MSTRRRFIEILPLAGVSLLAACSDKPEPAAPAPAAPAAPPAPAPVAPTPSAEAPAAPPAEAPPVAAAPAPATGKLPLVTVDDPTAIGLGYVTKAEQADAVKFKNYAPGQACANCAVYGAVGAPVGPCPLFPGRLVVATGWCSGYTRRAG
jgi:hypothetical protein